MSESKKTVFVVGLGPGGGQFLTVQAQSALQQAEVLCGYTVYLDLVRPYFPDKGTTVATVKRTMFEAMDLRKRAIERQKARDAEKSGTAKKPPTPAR